MNPNEPQMNTPMTPPPTQQAPHQSLGGLIGIVVIIGILVIGGLYIWGKNIVENGGPSQTTDAATEALNSQSSSTKASDIEADLNATNLENLDKELGDINAAIQ